MFFWCLTPYLWYQLYYIYYYNSYSILSIRICYQNKSKPYEFIARENFFNLIFSFISLVSNTPPQVPPLFKNSVFRFRNLTICFKISTLSDKYLIIETENTMIETNDGLIPCRERPRIGPQTMYIHGPTQGRPL